MQRITDFILLTTLYAIISICLPMIEGPIQDGHWIYWGGFIAATLGLGALLYSLIQEAIEYFKG